MSTLSLYYLNQQINNIVACGRKNDIRDYLRLNELINDAINAGYSVRIDKINKVYIVERCVKHD